uniref:Cytosol aminopeptidase domain-containing protein n=1 Tax=Strigamia maritima TaxID=126957 RepID=T1JK81_STRMM
VDEVAYQELSVLYVPEIPSHRLIFSPTGNLKRYIDDVRCVGEAATKGVQRALKSGSKSPLLIPILDKSFSNSTLVALLGALHGLYVPIECREFSDKLSVKVNKLGIFSEDGIDKIISLAIGLESGRCIARDIGGSDPERMTAPNVASYVKSIFQGTNVQVDIIDDQSVIAKDFPLLGAVNRATTNVERHKARVIHLTYTGEGKIDTTLMLVGKGVTYDTGGADIKAGGIMAGMHRDKCGSAAVAGFFQTLSVLKPKNIKVIGAMAMVRNSVGSECYVSDEIITSRSGMRVRICNTDAEGRMAMADLLCLMREKAPNEVNPHLFTIATLTGHAHIAVGEGYSIVIDNGPAHADNSAHKLQSAGEAVAEPVEISTLRREDFMLNSAKSEYEDIMQCNNLASSRTPRGHQFPAAFLVSISGLEKHDKNSEKPIKYSHMDIAASSGPFPGIPSGAPILALSARYLFSRV